MNGSRFDHRTGFMLRTDGERPDDATRALGAALEEIRERADFAIRETHLLVAEARRAVDRTRALVRGSGRPSAGDGTPSDR